MRGSPLIRTLIVLITLLAAGFGLSVLGKKRPIPQPITVLEDPETSKAIETPFVITLSSPAKQITLESHGENFELDVSSQIISGTLLLEEGHPTIFIDIEWAVSNPSPRFAKLVLEPAGHATQTKVFDAKGKLSDVWELHLHHDEHE